MKSRLYSWCARILLFSGLLAVASPAFAVPTRICVIEFLMSNGNQGDRWLGPFIADSIENDVKIFPEVRLVSANEGTAVQSSGKNLDLFRSEICEIAGKTRADYAIAGILTSNGGILSVNAYLFLVSEKKQIDQILFECPPSELYSHLDDIAVSFVVSMNISCSDEQVRRVRKTPTNSLKAMHSYGAALAATDASRDFSRHLAKALSLDRNYTDALAKLGMYYYRAGRFAEARTILERLADIQPDYPYLYYNLGLVHGARRQYTQAIIMYQRALQLTPQDSDAWNNLGRIYYVMGQREKATETFSRALEVNPDDRNALINLTRIDPTMAKKVETSLASRATSNHLADLAKLGRAYLEKGMFVRAQETFEEIEAVQPAYPHIYYNLGLAHSSQKKYDRAIEMYRKALAIRPEDSDAWNNLAVTYYAMDKPDDAIDALKQALKTDPDNQTAFANLERITKKQEESLPAGSPLERDIVELKQHVETGAAYYADGDYWRATDEFKKALEIHPNNFMANNNIALAYLKIGETELARTHFERALAADPTAVETRENLKKLTEKAVLPNPPAEPEEKPPQPPRPETLIALGNVHLARNDYAKAADAFSQALELSPENVAALNGLGAAYFSSGQYEKAHELFKKAQSLDPGNATTNQNLADVEFLMETMKSESEGANSFRLSIEPEIQARIRYMRANDFYEAGRYENAASEYKRALDLAPTSIEILNGLSKALFKLQRRDEAEAMLKRAQELDPNNELVNCKLDVLGMTQMDALARGDTFEDVPKDNLPRSEKEATTIVLSGPVSGLMASSPSSQMAQADNAQEEPEVANLDVSLNDEANLDLEDALMYYREAVHSEPQNAEAHYNLGNIYFSLGAFQSAIDSYQAASEINPLFAEAYNNMGVAYYELGHLRKAKAAWKHALEVNRSLESAKKNLKNLGGTNSEQ